MRCSPGRAGRVNLGDPGPCCTKWHSLVRGPSKFGRQQPCFPTLVLRDWRRSAIRHFSVGASASELQVCAQCKTFFSRRFNPSGRGTARKGPAGCPRGFGKNDQIFFFLAYSARTFGTTARSATIKRLFVGTALYACRFPLDVPRKFVTAGRACFSRPGAPVFFLPALAALRVYRFGDG